MSDAYELREVRMRHPNARVTARGRLELVLAVEDQGHSFREAARAFFFSVSTAFEWVSRWRRSSILERLGLRCLADRSSRPHRQPRLIVGELGMAHSSVWKVLARLRRAPPPGHERRW